MRANDTALISPSMSSTHILVGKRFDTGRDPASQIGTDRKRSSSLEAVEVCFCRNGFTMTSFAEADIDPARFPISLVSICRFDSGTLYVQSDESNRVRILIHIIPHIC